MNTKKWLSNKIVFGLIVFSVVMFILNLTLNKSSNADKNYQSVCYTDCVKTDITDQVGYGDHIWMVSSERYKNVVLKYSRFLSSEGAFKLTATYKDDNGKDVDLYGMSFDIDPDDVWWPALGNAELVFENGRIYLIGDKGILKSKLRTFANKLDKAAYILSIKASNHNDSLKPVTLLDGSKKVKG